MSASDFRSKPIVPAIVADLDLSEVAEVLARCGCNVSDAARDLNVPPSDLRRLLWANPALQDQAFEVVEGRLDLAEKNIAEALRSEDPRFRIAASIFTLRNQGRARRRGWITSSSGNVEVNVGPQRETVYSWRSGDAAKDDAKVTRLTEEGKRVVSIGWGNPDEPDEFIERDGQRIPAPRYGRGDVLEGEVATPAVLIEHAAAAVASEPEPEPEPVASSPTEVVPEPEAAAVRYERARIDKWIKDRLLNWPLSSCPHCRRPFVAGDAWEEVASFAEVRARARFHRSCHAAWRAERELAARQALGLEG
jgi:hypothetical protein